VFCAFNCWSTPFDFDLSIPKILSVSQPYLCFFCNVGLDADCGDFVILTPAVTTWVGTAIKHPVRGQVKPPVVIFDIRAL